MKTIILSLALLFLAGCLQQLEKQVKDESTCTLPSITVTVTDKNDNPYPDLDMYVYPSQPFVRTDAHGIFVLENVPCGVIRFQPRGSGWSYNIPHLTYSGYNDSIGTLTITKDASEYQLILPRILYTLKRSPSNPNYATSSPTGVYWDMINYPTERAYGPLFINAESRFFAQPFRPYSNISICGLGISWYVASSNVTNYPLTFRVYEVNLGHPSNLLYETSGNFAYINGPNSVLTSYGISASFLNICQDTGTEVTLNANTTYWIEIEYTTIPAVYVGAGVHITPVEQNELVGLDPVQSDDGVNWNQLYAGFMIKHNGIFYDVRSFTICGQSCWNRINGTPYTPDRFVIEVFAVE